VKVPTVPGADIGGKVLVTRSEPGASDLADALQAAGYAALVCPVIDIRSNDDPGLLTIVRRLDQFDIVIFVSGHAVRFGMDLIDRAWSSRPSPTWIAVGEATARMLAQRGVAALTPATETSEGILTLPQLSSVVGLRVLICAGSEGRSLLADELTRRGATVERLELYRRESVTVERTAECRIASEPIGAVVVASGDGARSFAAVWETMNGDRRVVVVAPSQRVAAELKGLGFQRVVVADGASSAAVIAALDSIAGVADEDG
jgi:uroporphyrinogen-III synthase